MYGVHGRSCGSCGGQRKRAEGERQRRKRWRKGASTGSCGGSRKQRRGCEPDGSESPQPRHYHNCQCNRASGKGGSTPGKKGGKGKKSWSAPRGGSSSKPAELATKEPGTSDTKERGRGSPGKKGISARRTVGIAFAGSETQGHGAAMPTVCPKAQKMVWAPFGRVQHVQMQVEPQATAGGLLAELVPEQCANGARVMRQMRNGEYHKMGLRTLICNSFKLSLTSR